MSHRTASAGGSRARYFGPEGPWGCSAPRLRRGRLLATCAQHIHEAVDNLANIDRPISSSMFGGRDLSFNVRPFLVGQVTWVEKLVPVVPGAVLWSPHAAPRESVTAIESREFRRHKPPLLTDSNDSHTSGTDTQGVKYIIPEGMMSATFLLCSPSVNYAKIFADRVHCAFVLARRRGVARRLSPHLMDRPLHMLRPALMPRQHHLLGLPQLPRAQINRVIQR